LSPEEMKRKNKGCRADKGDNNAEFTNAKAEKAAQKESAKSLAKLCS